MAIATLGGRRSVRVAVIGDPGTGKSSLIAAAGLVLTSFSGDALPPLHIPADYFPDRVPMDLIDTSSSSDNQTNWIAQVKAADAILITYACDRPKTFQRLSTYWLPALRRLKVRVPVIVVGCKLDVSSEEQKRATWLLMEEFREVETCIECSLSELEVKRVFLYAQKAVLHPISPLMDPDTRSLHRRCVSALKRIFTLYDCDMDGILSNHELTDFQVKCLNDRLLPDEIVEIKKVVLEKMPDEINDNGLTLTGFLFLQTLIIERDRRDITWAMLRKFGYDDNLNFRNDFLPTSMFRCFPDQSVELTNEAVDFLIETFYMFNMDSDDLLKPADIDKIFSTAPKSPWSDGLYEDATERNELGGLSLNGFLSKWALLTLLDPAASMANLTYIGYNSNPTSAFRITRRRRLDRRCQQSQRNTFQCFVFGPKFAGKSALLNALIGRTFSDIYRPTTSERFAVNLVELSEGVRKTFVMREIPEDHVESLLSRNDSLAACDVAVFVYDCSDEISWMKTTELLMEVASHGTRNGFDMPCLVVSAKDDLDPCPLAIGDLTRVSRDMGIENPIPVSMKLNDHQNLFRRIIIAAQHPHLSIPETEAWNSCKLECSLANHSRVSVSAVGAVALVIALATYSLYASRRWMEMDVWAVGAAALVIALATYSLYASRKGFMGRFFKKRLGRFFKKRFP